MSSTYKVIRPFKSGGLIHRSGTIQIEDQDQARMLLARGLVAVHKNTVSSGSAAGANTAAPNTPAAESEPERLPPVDVEQGDGKSESATGAGSSAKPVADSKPKRTRKKLP